MTEVLNLSLIELKMVKCNDTLVKCELKSTAVQWIYRESVILVLKSEKRSDERLSDWIAEILLKQTNQLLFSEKQRR